MFSRTSINDKLCLGRPSDTTMPKIIKKNLRFVTNDRKLQVCKISKMVNISTEHIHNILHNHSNI